MAAYRQKISGPLLDRIDLHVEVLRPSSEELREREPGIERSSDVARRVAAAWGAQMERAGMPNARLEGKAFDTVCRAGDDCWVLLERAADRFNLSARAHQRILRVARTIADLAGEAKLAPPHIAEALSLRCLDRRL